MLQYIIDGNNLIGKIQHLWRLQMTDGQASREGLVFMMQNYFYGKKCKVTLHFDGHVQLAIPSGEIKIVYSDDITADEKIRTQIERLNTPRETVVISSDHSIQGLARVCGCRVIPSENFVRELSSKKTGKTETELQSDIDKDEMKKLFGL